MALGLRQAAEGDAETVLGIILARDVADLGEPDYDLGDVHADLAEDGAEAWLTEDAQGYALLRPNGDLLALVHPDAEGRGLGTALLRHGEERARERGLRLLRQHTAGRGDAARALLQSNGYTVAQRFWRLRRELAAGEAPPMPEGGLRAFRPGEDDAEAHAVIQEAFTEIPGNVPCAFETWQRRVIGKPTFDPARCFVAEDEQGIAGVVMSEPFDGPGYIGEIAVAARARGRGLGRTLLRAGVAASVARGEPAITLSVNALNRSALRLYEGEGFAVQWTAERWEKAL